MSVRAIDTNVVARFLLDDDPRQSPIARDIVAAGVEVPLTVLVEIGWLLSSSYYGIPPAVVAQLLADFLDLPGVEIMRAQSVTWALERAAAGADLADMLHLVATDATRFATFDRGIAKIAGARSPVTIETLA